MSIIASVTAWLEWPFMPVSLDMLNTKAGMLERLDNKYVVDAATLRSALPPLAQSFDMLEIDGRRAFTYETSYFDTVDRRSYFDHHQGRRRRMKVRIRRYVDTNLCFVEVKLKDKRNVTVKKRLPYALAKFGVLDNAALDYIRQAYRDQYDEDFCHELARVLDMRYLRMTLVAKSGGERMTIDSRLRFMTPGSSRTIADDRFIIETKSTNGNGTADRILRSLHQHPTKHCSKYCMGVAVLHLGTRHNRFLPALRKLGTMPAMERMA